MMSECDDCGLAKRGNGIVCHWIAAANGICINGFHAKLPSPRGFIFKDQMDQIEMNKQFHTGQGHGKG